MNRVKSLIAISVFSMLVLCLPAIASAQNRDRDRDRDDDDYDYNRNGGYNNGGYNNGRYGNNGNYGDTRSIVRDLKNRTRELQRHLDRDLDDSRYNGTRREDELNDLARQFRVAVNRLSESNNGPRQSELQSVFDLGRQMDRYFSRTRVDYHIQEVWNGIQNDLQALDNSYRYNNRSSRNNRNYPSNYPNNYPTNNYPNSNRRGLPSWWPF